MVKTKATINPNMSSGMWSCLDQGCLAFVSPRWSIVDVGCLRRQCDLGPGDSLSGGQIQRGTQLRALSHPHFQKWGNDCFGPERGIRGMYCNSHHLDILGYLKINMPQIELNLLLCWVSLML